VADEGAVRKLILLEEEFDVLRQGSVVVSWVVRGVAVVTEIDGVDGSVQLAGEDSAFFIRCRTLEDRGCIAYLLMLRLFFLEPKRP